MKKITTITLALILVISIFVGCANSSTNSKNKYALEGSPSTLFNSSERRIWYSVREENMKKDGRIEAFYVFEDGKITAYEWINLTLGEITELSDDEIIESAKNYWKEWYYSTYQLGNDPPINIKRDDGSSGNTGTLDEIGELIYPQPSDFVFRIATDDTGNYTDYESLAYKTIDFKYSGPSVDSWKVEIIDDKQSYLTLIAITPFAYQIYDDYFAGFYNSSNKMLVTKVNGEFNFYFDQPGTEGIEVH